MGSIFNFLTVTFTVLREIMFAQCGWRIFPRVELLIPLSLLLSWHAPRGVACCGLHDWRCLSLTGAAEATALETPQPAGKSYNLLSQRSEIKKEAVLEYYHILFSSSSTMNSTVKETTTHFVLYFCLDLFIAALKSMSKVLIQFRKGAGGDREPVCVGRTWAKAPASYTECWQTGQKVGEVQP